MHSHDYHVRTPGTGHRAGTSRVVRNQPAASGWVIVNTGNKFLGPRWQVQCLPGGPLASQPEAIALARQAHVPCNDCGIVPLAWFKKYYHQGKVPA